MNIGIYKRNSLVCVLSGLLLVALMITDLMGEMNTLMLSVRNSASISAIKYLAVLSGYTGRKGKTMEKIMSYAVIFTYSFDNEVAVYLFETEEEAKDFLKSYYKEELRVDIEESGWHSEGTISEDGWYAKIETYFVDGGNKPDVTEFRIGSIYQ